MHNNYYYNRPNNDSFDLLLADSFVSNLKKSIGTSKFNRAEEALHFLFRSTVMDCMSYNYSGRMAWILMSHLGDVKFKKTVQEIAKEMFSVSKKGYKNKITLHDKKICKKILSFYDNEQKRKILDTLSDKSIGLQRLENLMDIPQTTFHRHVKELVDGGLLVVLPSNNQNVRTSLFSNLSIVESTAADVNHDKVQIIIKTEFLDSSLLYRIHPFAKKYRKKLVLPIMQIDDLKKKKKTVIPPIPKMRDIEKKRMRE